ncbi:MAG: hypothetical protein U5K29_04235 [Acidimicrobiales bacterium]|nr:hypothetical protein [Acidimicrobiales bacterium]
MSATTKPTPGSAAAILEVAVHSVAEGRYRHARLTLLRAAASALLPDIVELVNDASTAADLPAGLTPATVIERGKPPMLPGWLDAALDVEIARICAGSPVAEPTPDQLVARITGAVCIDVCADIHEAAARADVDAAGEHGPEDVAAAIHHRHRMLDLDSSEVIHLEADAPTGSGNAGATPHSS